MKDTLEYLLNLKPVGGECVRERDVKNLLLSMAISQIGFKGVVCEFGVQSGRSSRALISQIDNDTPIYLFDSFEGLPEAWAGHPKGSFKTDIIPSFKEENVTVVKGLFKDTLKDFNPDTISFIHIDCDLYSSTFTALTMCDKFIKRGTIIQFDEFYNYNHFKEHEYKALIDWGRAFEYVGRSVNEQVVVRIL